MEPLIDETSAISERPPGTKPKSCRRDCRFGCKTLSSLAFPIFEFGLSCSLNMLNRAERLGIIKLVRKLSVEGRTAVRSISTFGSGCPFFHFFAFFVSDVARELTDVSSGAFLSFFLVRKRFIVALYELVKIVWLSGRPRMELLRNCRTNDSLILCWENVQVV